jgi:Transposase and inactivated derivatives
MLSLPAASRYFFYRPETDMRKGFDGLSGIVRNALRKDPLGGDIFIFVNRRRNQVKLLLFEGDGFSIYHKRLERGTYEIPAVAEDHVVLRHEQLQFILQGVCLSSVRHRKRFQVDQRKIANVSH